MAVELSKRGALVSGCDVDGAGLKETATLCAGELHTAGRVVVALARRMLKAEQT